MEPMFMYLLVLGIFGIVIAILTAETWTPTVITSIVTALLAIVLFFYWQLPIELVSQRTIITEKLGVGELGDDQDSRRMIIFGKPTTILITVSRRWGSAMSYTTFEVKSE